MTIKDFDCIEMKRKGALRIHERLEGKTLEEKIEYWRKRSEEFRLEQEEILSHGPIDPARPLGTVASPETRSGNSQD